jgi:hypothetical protein
MSTIQLKPAGQPAPKLEKRAIESILYTLDCAELLQQHELIVRVDVPATKSGLIISDLRPRKGKSLELRIDNDVLGTVAYIDYNVQLLFYTSFNNSKSAVFQLRVHK